MRRLIHFLALTVVFAMTLTLGSCAKKTDEQINSEISQSEADQFKEVTDMMLGYIGMNFNDVTRSLGTYFGISFDLENYSDLDYYSEEEGYCEYFYNKKVSFASVGFDQIRMFTRIDNGTVFHVSFVCDTDTVENLDGYYQMSAGRCTELFGAPRGVREATSGPVFNEFRLGEGMIVSTGRYISDDYNSFWIDTTDWMIND